MVHPRSIIEKKTVLFLLCVVGWLLPFTLQCTTPQSPTTSTQTSAVVAGTPDTKYPAVGALSLGQTTLFCTGTLIAPRLVLTAAHCAEGALQAKLPKVFFRTDEPDSTGKLQATYHAIQRAVVHPQYASGQTVPDFDLGLLVLTKPVRNITPISMLRAPMLSTWKNTKALVMGYGLIQTRPSFQTTNTKHSASIPITDINSKIFIQQDPQGKQSACHGDSGGPVLYQAYGRIQVIGVISAPYKATVSPVPNRTYCDGGSIATRVDTNLNFLLPYLLKYNLGKLSCTDNQECATCRACETNTTKQCQPKPVSRASTFCQPCQKDSDCSGGVCQRFPDGYRCVQRCNSEGCCPQATYCDTTQAKVQTGNNLCLPLQDTCPPVACTQDETCGLDGVCEQGTCKLRPIPKHPTYCHPCITSKQCGEDNLCINSLSGLGVCLQACTQGDFCPQGTKCQAITPGLKQCVPIQGCTLECNDKISCPKSMTCKQGTCTRTSGSHAGDFCSSERPCPSPQYICLPTSLGSRCMQRCGPPLGAEGSPCQQGNCNSGLHCTKLPGGQDVCLKVCNGYCTAGRCLRISPTVVACICRNNSECPSDFLCDTSILGTFGDGVCIPKNQAQGACPQGLECQPNAPFGRLCGPTRGDRPAFTTCSFIQRCNSGLQCRQFSPDKPAVCYEVCKQSSSICGFGGTCTLESNNQGICMCQSSLQCNNKNDCILVGDTGQSLVGYCDRSTETSCRLSLDCPAEHICDQGTCRFDPTRANPSPESTKEPNDKPQEEPNPTDASSEPERREQNPEPSTTDRGEPSTETQAPTQDSKPPELPQHQACGCSSTPTHPVYSFVLFLLAIIMTRAIRRESNLSHQNFHSR